MPQCLQHGTKKKLHDKPALPLQRAGKGTALEVLLVFFRRLVPRLEKAIRNAFKLAAVTVKFLAEPGLNFNDAAPHIRRWRIRTDGGDLPVALARSGAQQPHDLNFGAAPFGFQSPPHFFQQFVAP